MIQEISNPNYLSSGKYEKLKRTKLLKSIFDIPVLLRKVEVAKSELFNSFETYLDIYDKDTAQYAIDSFDDTDLGRMGASLSREDEFWYDEVLDLSYDIVKMLEEEYPEEFSGPYVYTMNWDEGRLVFFVLLERSALEELQEAKGMKKENPNYLTEKKIDELEDKKEAKTERTFYQYLEKHGSLNDDDIEQLMDILAMRCRSKTCKALHSVLRYSASLIPRYSIIERLTKQNGKWEYTAGQSHSDEIATIRKIMLTETGKKSNPDYLKNKFDQLDRVKELVRSGYEVYSDSYRTHYGNKDLEKALLNPDAFITSDLFRYTDYGGGYTVAKANIRYIEENFTDLIEKDLISSYGTAHHGENMEFKFKALANDELFEVLLGLKDYPVIDDSTLSEVEMEIEEADWDSYGRDDFRKALEDKYGEEAEKLTNDDVDNLAYEASQYTCCGRGEISNMDFSFDIKGLVDAVSKLEEGKKLMKKSNPMPKCENPSWASDEDIWEKAKKQSLKSYGRISYPFVVYLYKQMGGKIKKKK